MSKTHSTPLSILFLYKPLNFQSCLQDVMSLLGAHAFVAVLDDHGNHHAGVVCGRHAHEPAVVAVGLLGRARLAGHFHAVDLRGGAGALLDNALEDLADAFCGVCADGGAQLYTPSTR